MLWTQRGGEEGYVTSEDVAGGLCALWDHRCRQGHPSSFDRDKRSLEELHGVLEGYLSEGRRPGVLGLTLENRRSSASPSSLS